MGNRRHLPLATLALVATAACALSQPSAHADVVIGDWENDTDGWIDWGGGQTAIAAPKFTYSTDVGVTHGTHSLKLENAGWNQNLSIKLQDAGHREDFFANKKFMIDVTYPAVTGPGWSEIFEFVFNSPLGWTSLMGSPVAGTHVDYGDAGGPAQTFTLTWDYSALVDGNPDNGELPPDAGWVEFVFSTNNENHPVIYFDNARLVGDAPPRIAGDTNGDGVVDLADLNNVLNNFGDTGASPGDDNGDQVVDLEDLNRVLNNFGDTAPAAVALSVVPEPAALSSILYPLSSLFLRRRRRHV